jgi:CRISPR/Cas system-associated exonuclease Cas4 (RecB family)
VNRYVVKFGVMGLGEMMPVVKTQEDVVKIKETVLSATAVQNYLACPAKFYYSVVKGLKTEDEVSESLDYGMFGTVYHDTIRAVYSVDDGESISREYIKSWLGRGNEIREIVKSVIIREMNAVEVSGRNLVVADVITRYVLKTLECDLQQLEEAGVGAFTILGRELKVSGELHGQKFKGFIDRLDSFAPDQARVVDYKTGRVLDEDENIDDDNAEAVAEKIFAPDVKDRPKIALQFYIYDMLVESLPQIKGRRIYNCVYSTSRLFSSLPSVVPANSRFCSEMTARLKNLLDEMYDVSVPFRRTEDQDICKYCDFKSICGR